MSKPAYSFDPDTRSLKSSVGKGFMTTAASQAVKIGVQVASVILLSRILAPEDFGIVAMVAPVLAFIMMLQDMGLNHATVQRAKITHDEVNFLFWVNIAISLVLTCVLLGTAPLIALFYGEPRVGPFVAALSINVVLTAGSSQHMALLSRKMEFGRIAIIESVAALSLLSVSIVFAFIYKSYWGLWTGWVGSVLATLILSWFFSGWRPTRPRNAENGWSMINFGAGITGFNFANYFARNLDNILIGRYYGGFELGLYDRAYKLLLFPLTQITNPLGRVMVPALSRLADAPDRYRNAFLRVLRLLLLGIMPGVAWATATSDSLILLLLGSKWAESAVIFSSLGFAGMVQILNNPSGWLFISQGRSREFALWGLMSAALSVVAFGSGIPWGAWGVATAYAIVSYLKTPLLWWFLGRSGPISALDIWKTSFPFVAGAHLSLAAVWFGRPLLNTGYLGLLETLTISYFISFAFSILFRSGRENFNYARENASNILLSLKHKKNFSKTY